MAKKINFSVTNEELFELETIAKKRGKKVVEIIRERYESGKKKESIKKKFDQISSHIESNKNEISNQIYRIFSALDMLVRQSTISNEILSSIIKGNLKDEEKLNAFQDLIYKKSDENSKKMKQIFFEN
jgi:hypothetical protein